MKDLSKTYFGDTIRVRFQPRRCIHAAECVARLPEVFDPERRPWIDPAKSGADVIAQTIARCPTGALHFDRLDGGTAEAPDAKNQVHVNRNGPLYLRGVIELKAEDGSVVAQDVRLALCRCGASRSKPFCDNTHRLIRFVDRGEVFEGGVKPATGDLGRSLNVTVEANGPYRLSGPVTVESSDGRVRLEGGSASLCRCGASRNKPFCDGSHKNEDLSSS